MAKTETFTDDFATADSSKWTFGSADTVSGGVLTLTATSAYDGYAVSNSTFDLTGSYVMGEITSVTNAGNGSTECWIGVTLSNTSDNDSILIGVTSGSIAFRETIGGTRDVTTITYSATNHRWWRISSSGTTITWETSPTGQAGSWTTQRTKTTSLTITSVHVMALTGYWGTESAPGSLGVESINVVPATGGTTWTATPTRTWDGTTWTRPVVRALGAPATWWAGSNPAAGGTNGPWDIGIALTVNAPILLTGIRVYGAGQTDVTGRVARVWDLGRSTQLTSWTIATTISTGWQSYALPTPLLLRPGMMVGLVYQVGANFPVLASALASAVSSADGALTSPATGARYGSVGSAPTTTSTSFYGVDATYRPAPIAPVRRAV